MKTKHYSCSGYLSFVSNLLLTLRETYTLNRLSSFQKNQDERAANFTTAPSGQRSCYATVSYPQNDEYRIVAIDSST